MFRRCVLAGIRDMVGKIEKCDPSELLDRLPATALVSPLVFADHQCKITLRFSVGEPMVFIDAMGYGAADGDSIAAPTTGGGAA